MRLVPYLSRSTYIFTRANTPLYRSRLGLGRVHHFHNLTMSARTVTCSGSLVLTRPGKPAFSTDAPKQPPTPEQLAQAHVKATTQDPIINKPDQTTPFPVFATEGVTPKRAENVPKKPTPTTHPRFSRGWWWDWGIVFLVFAITGSTTMRVVRPLVSQLFGVEGTFIDGPWAYRLLYLSTTLPLYSLILIAVGTAFGRGAYFRAVAYRMWGRFLPNRKR
ncbi:uncharacterized protein SPPG_02013 [Spizellomyces punctatus DAOM BR117]|uniref:DUF6787 domain-containing protein n=1 Tax=Spizellomyces punctatus (strain DAOM BR117) TaxID=645134 RepID=A0A0L0HPE7_SPIPD|nr:uncharacterized protein SPPG_02013 [Spizellomyces punctatus DAOM BR117]KND02933.1 hypothetical protein SPPG_02013 [Spizellomyces punctatus DAOM BR117]|eukprot:XP_016610972.1 hypothetical protein SPPG_02013 [Spizellomyces punctatus DAOM BR117]